MYSLKDTNIVGGTSGIGLAVAKAFVDDGATVTITGRLGNGAKIGAEIGAVCEHADSTSSQELETALGNICGRHGPIDCLIVNAEDTDDDGSPEALTLAQLTAFGRMGKQHEVVGAYHFLAGDGSTFITGQELRVDGGLTAGIGLPVLDAVSGKA